MMKCEFCEKEEYIEGFPKAFNYAGGITYSCSDCAGEFIATDDLTPIELPGGWQIVKSDDLHDLKKARKAFFEASSAMAESVETWQVSSGYMYDLAGFYERIIQHWEKRVNNQKDLRQRLGLLNFDEAKHATGGYCPSCTGPLLRMVGIKKKSALAVATSEAVKIMKPTRVKRNPVVLVCLQCGTAYK